MIIATEEEKSILDDRSLEHLQDRKKLLNNILAEIKIESSKVIRRLFVELKSLINPLVLVFISTFILSILYFVFAESVTKFGINATNQQKEFAKSLGSTSENLVWIGTSFVILRRIYEIIRGMDKSKYNKVQKLSIMYYRKLRKPFLILHNISLIIATIIGIIHGLFLLNKDFFAVYTGIFTSLFMVIISLTGLIMYYRINFMWKKAETKKIVTFIHRQWIFSLFFLLFIIIHYGSG